MKYWKFLLVIGFLISCVSRPQNAIVGKWMGIDVNNMFEFFRDGTISIVMDCRVIKLFDTLETVGGRNSMAGEYKFVDNDHLRISIEGYMDKVFRVYFSNDTLLLVEPTATVFGKYLGRYKRVNYKDYDPRRMWSELAKKERKDPSSIRVQVLNGSGKIGMARKVASFLREKGFDVVDVDNSKYVSRTFIQDRRDRDRANAIPVQKALKQGKLAFEPDPALFLEVTVIIGGDFNPRILGIKF